MGFEDDLLDSIDDNDGQVLCRQTWFLDTLKCDLHVQ